MVGVHVCSWQCEITNKSEIDNYCAATSCKMPCAIPKKRVHCWNARGKS